MESDDLKNAVEEECYENMNEFSQPIVLEIKNLTDEKVEKVSVFDYDCDYSGGKVSITNLMGVSYSFFLRTIISNYYERTNRNIGMMYVKTSFNLDFQSDANLEDKNLFFTKKYSRPEGHILTQPFYIKKEDYNSLKNISNFNCNLKLNVFFDLIINEIPPNGIVILYLFPRNPNFQK